MNIDEEFYKKDHHGEFEKPFMWAIIGWYLGAMLARTKFGQWFEYSPVVGWILSIFCLAVAGYTAYCVIAYVVILLGIMLG